MAHRKNTLLTGQMLTFHIFSSWTIAHCHGSYVGRRWFCLQAICKSQDSLHLPTTLSERLNHIESIDSLFKGSGVAGSLRSTTQSIQEPATSFLRAQSQSSRSFESMLFKAICICQNRMCWGDQCICQSWMSSTYMRTYNDLYVDLRRHHDMLILTLSYFA